MSLKSKIRKRLFTLYGLTTRAMTLGVRAAVFDDNGNILLVRHTYVAGWHFPGGGVERGETLAEAVAKEVREETMIDIGDPQAPFHVYKNPRTSRFDHVAMFVSHDWAQIGEFEPNREIAEIGFFPASSLPESATQAVHDRLAEIMHGQPRADIW